jgi:hypothetical protein
MRIRQAITLDFNDLARIERVEEAWLMIGGRDLPDEQQRPFRRIRGNDFTLEEALTAQAIIEVEAAKPIPIIFEDASLQATWATGQQQSKTLAVEQMRRFLDYLRDDLTRKSP